jgi:signal transduction histidine kinase
VTGVTPDVPGGQGASVERKIAAVVVLAAAVLGVIGFVSIRSTRSLISEADRVAHSHLVLEHLEKVLAHVGRLESDQRGYLLTGDESYLDAGRGDGEPVARTFADLRALVADEPRQLRLVERLEPVTLRRIAARDEIVTLRRREGLDAAIATLRRNRGRHLMRNVRTLVDRMRRVERRLLAARAARADAGAVRTLRIVTGGSVLALLVLVGMSAWIRRDLHAGEQAARDLRDARDHLRDLKEEADAANQAKSEFLTSMSHELRTPLNSIIGFSQLMLRSPKSVLDPEDRDGLVTVQRNAHQLLALINQVLDLSRVEAGAIMLSTTRLDLAVLAREVVQDARPLVGTKPLTLEIDVPPAPLVVDGDPMRIRQILTNVIGNAIKYTAEGSVRVLVAEVYDLEVGAAARVTVRDTGPGISDDDQARLFQRFVRLDTEATRRESGTGLGLSVSQELAHMHGGRIQVESDGRSWTAFVLTLPAVAVCAVDDAATRRAG